MIAALGRRLCVLLCIDAIDTRHHAHRMIALLGSLLRPMTPFRLLGVCTCGRRGAGNQGADAVVRLQRSGVRCSTCFRQDAVRRTSFVTSGLAGNIARNLAAVQSPVGPVD